MYCLSLLLTKRRALDICGFYFYREFSDGITFFVISCSFNSKGDHTPSFSIEIRFFNYTLLDFCYYDIYHEKQFN